MNEGICLYIIIARFCMSQGTILGDIPAAVRVNVIPILYDECVNYFILH